MRRTPEMCRGSPGVPGTGMTKQMLVRKPPKARGRTTQHREETVPSAHMWLKTVRETRSQTGKAPESHGVGQRPGKALPPQWGVISVRLGTSPDPLKTKTQSIKKFANNCIPE